ncbi:MAG: SEC-C metal-binding domain-containing protein [Bryobacteraceae bacterium]
MTDFALDKQQLKVIDALSGGANLARAAALAGVHPNHIDGWLRNSLNFQVALSHALYSHTLRFRERAVALADRAFTTLSDILHDPQSSPSVRLKAATFIIETAMAPPPYKLDKPLGLFDQPVDVLLGKIKEEVKEEREDEDDQEEDQEQESQPAAQEPATMHKNAQERETCRRPNPKIGRNRSCPCGSGKKYKNCCLNKPFITAA